MIFGDGIYLISSSEEPMPYEQHIIATLQKYKNAVKCDFSNSVG